MSKKRKNNKSSPGVIQQVTSPSESEQRSTTSVAVQTTSHSGPIPSSQELANYDLIIPGSAERILQMAEANNQHQIDLEILALTSARKEQFLGQIFALLVTTMAFASAITAMIMGYSETASIIAGTTVVGLAIAFIKGAKSNHK